MSYVKIEIYWFDIFMLENYLADFDMHTKHKTKESYKIVEFECRIDSCILYML